MNPIIRNALIALRQGQTILYPTETVWGIGCDATHELSVKKIARIKNRRKNKPFILLVDSVNTLRNYIDTLPENSEELLHSEEPVTVIFPQGKNVNPLVLGEDGTIAFRLARHPFCRELLTEFRKPLVSTSANLSGHVVPGKFSEVSPEIISKIDYVVEWSDETGMLKKSSAIIRINRDGKAEVVRE